MSNPQRATVLNKLYKVLKKHYKPVAPQSGRTVLEHLLYACCLENAKHQDADDAFAKLQESHFDWNEVRVTTVAELAESVSNLPNATYAASNLKRCLQVVFESQFAFDLELLKKQNLGKSEKDLEKFASHNPFLIAYVTQHGLGGHAIPCGEAEIELLYAVGVITDQEADKRQVPGLERAVPKNKGIEFASLLHQLAAEFQASPNSTKLKAIVAEVESGFKDRIQSRLNRKAEEAAAAERARLAELAKQQAKEQAAREKAAAAAAATERRKAAQAAAAAQRAAAEKARVEAAKRPADVAKKVEPPKKPEPPKKSESSKKPELAKKSDSAKPEPKKAELIKKPEPPKKKDEKEKSPHRDAKHEAKKHDSYGGKKATDKGSDSKRLAKKKPR